MEAVIDAGIPVEIGRIDKELGRLWESSDDTKTRASLINLAIYCECPESLARNTAIISEIAGQHACRAILILADPKAAESRARAWISAHCHLAGKGGRQICSEQITFQLDGDAADALPNIVFSHLDSDLPLCFWWQGDFHERVDEKLWAWVDRLLFDSAGWKAPAVQFSLLDQIAAMGESAPYLCDLNWARLYHTRFALATMFDHSEALARLPQIDRVEIDCAPGHRTTAVLLLGWLAVQLGWSLHSLLAEEYFVSKNGVSTGFRITECEGPSISRVRLATSDAHFEIRRPEGSDFYHGCIQAPGLPETLPTLGAGREKITDILLAELGRAGRHPIYAKVRTLIAPLLA
ncbi:MAG: glucose-6-phosphate dehydrogenase assembly protein OpcA [Terrimicrobiaceae bacterium]|nr:glucose-6-phosphate dehydrogenase assembly protein OpcA [Terrimicrobiaceae bacterium]